MPRSTDINRARVYTEQYRYDPVGNIEELKHMASGAGSTRSFTLASGNNRLDTVAIGTATSFRYRYDDNGNMTEETTSRHFEWDHSDRMRVFRTQPGDGGASLHAHYLYDTGGQRIKKLVRNGGGQVNVTVYIDGIFEHHRSIRAGTASENNSLHVMDNQSRIALVRIGTPFARDATPAVKYHLGDHLGSSNVVLGGATAARNGFITREEYTPYGETSFGSFAKKRYRFTSKERDEESGLYYVEARYYAPWVGRWASTDPAWMKDGLNLYAYARSNPMSRHDPYGTQSQGAGEDESSYSVRSNPEKLFIENENAGKNWNAAANQVLESEFGLGDPAKNRAAFEAKIDTLSSGPQRVDGRLDPGSKSGYARGLFDQVRQRFYELEAKSPSWQYSDEQKDRLKRGAAPDPKQQIEHLFELAEHPKEALDYQHLYFTEGGLRGSLPKGSPHWEKHFGETGRRLRNWMASRGIRPNTAGGSWVGIAVVMYLTAKTDEEKRRARSDLIFAVLTMPAVERAGNAAIEAVGRAVWSAAVSRGSNELVPILVPTELLKRMVPGRGDVY
jgi:RHS repeat-associated protein